MADHTRIEWTDATWNPIRARNRSAGGVGHFCVRVSDGCRNCYAERMQPRFHNPIRYAAQDLAKVELVLDEAELLKPLRWKRPRMIFVCSMTDLFLEAVPAAWIDRLFAVMALCPQHTFQVLTKRADRARAYLSHSSKAHDILDANQVDVRIDRAAKEIAGEWAAWNTQLGGCDGWPLHNVWLGTSVEDQAAADERIPILLDTPAAVRWISAEPLLGPVDFAAIPPIPPLPDGMVAATALIGLDWVVAGGESGPGARPMHPDWARSLRDQCAAAGVPFLFKQWGEWSPHVAAIESPDGTIKTTPKGGLNWRAHQPGSFGGMFRVGKKRAGRLLDGELHDGFPEIRR